MIEVSKETFYRAIGGPEDIIPRSERDETIWEINHSRQRVGRSLPGYANTCPAGTKCYWLTDEFAAKKGIRP